jgi:glycosyltransferase involved in cell wall biosynthesis
VVEWLSVRAGVWHVTLGVKRGADEGAGLDVGKAHGAAGLRELAECRIRGRYHLVQHDPSPDGVRGELLPDRYRRLSCKREEMEALYPCADVFLHLSRDESFGIANLEALATGVPLVVQDAPVARWLLEDQARFVDSDDEAGIAAALQSALRDGAPDRRMAGRELARRRFGWATIATQYSEFLNDVHGEPEHAARGALTLRPRATREEVA